MSTPEYVVICDMKPFHVQAGLSSYAEPRVAKALRAHLAKLPEPFLTCWVHLDGQVVRVIV